VNVALLALSYAWGADAHDAVLLRMGANIGANVRSGEVYRLFASAFLHANIVHLGFNMLALWSLGPFLETLLGRRRYVVLYAAAALGGALASTLFGGGRWSVGASGAIFGLMGAGVSLALRPKGLLPDQVVAAMKRRAAGPLVFNLLYSLSPGIDMAAHLGGGIVGALLMATVLTNDLVPMGERRELDAAERAPSPLYKAAAWLMAAAMAASVVVAFVAGRPWQVNAPPQLQRTSVGDTGISLELPTVVLGDVSRTATEPGTTVDRYSYGSLLKAPIAFEIVHGRLAGTIPEGEIDAVLDHERKALDDQIPADATSKSPAQVITLGGHKAIHSEYTANTVHQEVYLIVVGDHEVVIRAYSTPRRPASWSDIERAVAGSVTAP
jgi:membrane associated rhomboid family serine protease